MEAPLFDLKRLFADLRFEFAHHRTNFELPEDLPQVVEETALKALISEFEIVEPGTIDTPDYIEGSHQIEVPQLQPLSIRHLRTINLKLEQLLSKIHVVVSSLHHPKNLEQLEHILNAVRFEHGLIEEANTRFRSSTIMVLLQASGAFTINGVRNALGQKDLSEDQANMYLRMIRRYNERHHHHLAMLTTCSKIADQIKANFGNDIKYASVSKFTLKTQKLPIKNKGNYLLQRLKQFEEESQELRANVELMIKKADWWATQLPLGADYEANPWKNVRFSENQVIQFFKKLNALCMESSGGPSAKLILLEDNIQFLLSNIKKYAQDTNILKIQLFGNHSAQIFICLKIKPKAEFLCEFFTYLPKEHMLKNLISAEWLDQDFSVRELSSLLVELSLPCQRDLITSDELQLQLTTFLQKAPKQLLSIKLYQTSTFAEQAKEAKMISQAFRGLWHIVKANEKNIDSWPVPLKKMTQTLTLQLSDGIYKTATLGIFLSVCVSSQVLHYIIFEKPQPNEMPPLAQQLVDNPSTSIDLSEVLTTDEYKQIRDFSQNVECNFPVKQQVKLELLLDRLGCEHQIGAPMTDCYEFMIEMAKYPTFFRNFDNRKTSYAVHILSQAFVQRKAERVEADTLEFFEVYDEFQRVLHLIRDFNKKDSEQGKTYYWKFITSTIHLYPAFVGKLLHLSEDLDPAELDDAIQEIAALVSSLDVHPQRGLKELLVLYKNATELHRLIPIPELMVKLKTAIITDFDKRFDQSTRINYSNINENTWIGSGFNQFNDMLGLIIQTELNPEIELMCLKKFYQVLKSRYVHSYQNEIKVKFYTLGLTLLKRVQVDPSFMEEMRFQPLIPFKFLGDLITRSIELGDYEMKHLLVFVDLLNELTAIYPNETGMILTFQESCIPPIQALRVISKFKVASLTLPSSWFKSFYTKDQINEIKAVFPKTTLVGI